MMRRPLYSLIAVTLAVVVVGAACGTEEGGGGKTGGSIVLGAEQFPDCLNPVDSCANASWLGWAVTQHILPKAMTITTDGTFEATPLLTEAPTLENGGIKENPFRVTYKINPDAVWDDGTPITSKDFEFTWQAHVKTTGSLFTVGYDKITSVDTTDPKTAVVTYKETFADWPDNFGGNTDFVLKSAAFPNGPDLKGTMQQDIPFSGGPFTLDSYSKNQIVLVPNARYWGPKPKLERVTFVPREEQNTEITSLLSGEIAGIYPQPNVEMPRRLKASNVKFVVGGGTTYEGLWLNLDKAPLNDKAVREALFWATDRQAIVDTIIKPINPDAEILNCTGWVPTVGDWCDNTDFADFDKYDIAKAKQILDGAGWTLGGDGIYAKGGQRLSLVFSTTAGNKGREDTQALLKEKWKAAGIELVVKNFASPSPIFTDVLPKGNFSVAEYAQVSSPDPSVTSLYACEQIPTAANDYSGQNFDRWCNQRASELTKQSDRTVDPAERLKLIQQVGDLVREDLVWFPLYQKPLITAWRTDKIAGPVGEYNSTPLGGFYNLWEWSLA
jgi:peptide/nickel transport system substrate-binding protein